MTAQVAVLFARRNSIYKQMEGCDVYDVDRDARTWVGGCAIVAHPPCRAWGRLRMMAKPRPDERDLAMWSVARLRQYGGVLEHPHSSLLWPAANLPSPGRFDLWGGFTLPVLQQWWGHRAEKATWLYVVGCSPAQLPEMELSLGRATHFVAAGRHRPPDQKELSKAGREATPPRFAQWLVELARRCKVS